MRTLVTASAHIVTAVIGSGVLSLAWGIAQLGWVAGPAVLMAFSITTFFTSILLADSYRAPGPMHGVRNYTYMDVVRAHLGGAKVKLCGLAQYGNLVGVTIGYTITASISMVAVKKSNCFHRHGHDHVACSISNNPFMIIFAAIQVVLSQIPNFHKLWWLSIVAAIMSFAYSTIGVGLSIAKVAVLVSRYSDIISMYLQYYNFFYKKKIKIWIVMQTFNVNFQDTLKSDPPENKVMKKASFVGVSTTTLFYMLCSCAGYAAFGNNAPGNFLTGFGFYEPFWLIDLANICIAIHLLGAYQVFAQPVFGFVEKLCSEKWPENKFITTEHAIYIPLVGPYNINFCRLVWRTVYVIFTAVVAMIFPFFNDFLGLIGAATFYPLTVYFPIEIYIAQAKIPKYSFKWICLKILNCACLLVSLVGAAGSIQGLAQDVKTYKPFQTQS
ncbi:amino acid permease 6-like [Primulina huaijiensis]|uniref:amino acid permease 6-like n=1 Tax=Primulina huaijiensis TaxID=1492673 RepID=UPI003CC7030B